jgi:hypothetical protein
VQPLHRGDRGAAVEYLQRADNQKLRARKFPWRQITPDRVAGRQTFHATHFVAWLIGFSGEQLRRIENGIIPIRTQRIIRGLERRTAGMKARDLARRPKAAVLRRRHRESGGVNFKGTSPGDPHWSGSRYVIEDRVDPVMARHGIPVTSRKRTDTLGNPGSDHDVGNTTAYATDYGTYDGAEAAHGVARSLGIDNYSVGDYTSYYVTFGGRTFRVQILWAVSGHFDHVHVGVRAS